MAYEPGYDSVHQNEGEETVLVSDCIGIQCSHALDKLNMFCPGCDGSAVMFPDSEQMKSGL